MEMYQEQSTDGQWLAVGNSMKELLEWTKYRKHEKKVMSSTLGELQEGVHTLNEEG